MVTITVLIKRWHKWLLENFMRETQWEFNILYGYKDFKKTIEKNITVVPKYYFTPLPIDLTKKEGIYGYIENEEIKIRLRPKKISLKGLFATSSGCNFIGKIYYEDNKTFLNGSYQTYPLARRSSLFLLYISFLILLIHPLIVILILLYSHNIDIIITLLLQMCFSLLFLVVIFFVKKIQNVLNANETREIYNFLLVCSKTN